MANALKKDLNNRRVLLKKEIFKPEYQEERHRIVRVLCGFGAEPNTIGTTIFVEFESNGMKANCSGYDVEKILE